MSRDKYIVALDIGTSGCRAVAVDGQGRSVAQYAEILSPMRPGKGCSQYDGAAWLRIQQRVVQHVIEQVGADKVAALAIASQRSTVVLWDKESGLPLAPVLTWEDGRSVQEAASAPVAQPQVHQITGLYKTPFFSASKILWALRHVPAVEQALKKGTLLAAPVPSYFIWHASKQHLFATDYTMAQRMLLLDIRSRTWSAPLCEAFRVPTSILPALYSSAADFGTYEYKGYSIPIYACVGDQQAAAYWQQLKTGASCINYGTGAFWLYNAGNKGALLDGMLTSLAAGEEDAKQDYLLEGTVNAAGSALLWLKTKGFLFEENEVQTLCTQAKNPVLFLPALGGLGAPYFDFNVSAAAENLTPHTAKSDWVAGVVRGIACLLADIGAYLQANGFPVTGPIGISGGLSNIDYLAQFQADILQRPLTVLPQQDATVLGAAKLAARHMQWDVSSWHTEATATVEPHLLPAQAQQLYVNWQRFVQRVRAGK